MAFLRRMGAAEALSRRYFADQSLLHIALRDQVETVHRFADRPSHELRLVHPFVSPRNSRSELMKTNSRIAFSRRDAARRGITVEPVQIRLGPEHGTEPVVRLRRVRRRGRAAGIACCVAGIAVLPRVPVFTGDRIRRISWGRSNPPLTIKPVKTHEIPGSGSM